MKKSFTNGWRIGAAVILIAAMTSGLLAQDRSRDRGSPIIFTSPKADIISTNLHEVNVKQAPFKNLEAEIRKPFEIFDAAPPKPKFTMPRQNNPPPTINRSNLKAIMEKSAEEQFLNGKQSGQEDPNDPFALPESSMETFGKKPKTALDRYYDRLEREQVGRTNKSAAAEMFGNQKEKSLEEKRTLEANQAEKNLGREQEVYSRANGQMSNNAAGNGNYRKKFAGERSFSESTSDPFDRATTQRETRMDNFKKLLDGPTRFHPQNNTSVQKPPAYGSTGTSAQRSYLTPTPSWSSTKPASPANTVPGSSFSKSSSIVGTAARPAGLQDFASSASASLSTPIAPVQQTKVKPSTFNPPTRR